ncbi:hypothetical protein [Clostridium estertheticum]|uniref:Cap15 family cyclic dinucleotide receptor domain-containing protein n=1 Tax=Clostridium estertheticum TaxID=238834 RepID=UPI001CF20E83|nr:hypothetical protein [Clostridium estertheticum]MCB2361962.1 hypothetical protein [Clostridium estertheticum]
MNKMHNYSVNNHPKAKFIFYLVVISGIIASAINKTIQYLLNQKFHLDVKFILSTAIVFSVVYFIFSKWVWKNKIFGEIFKFPNLNGKYEIDGLSLKNPTGAEIPWTGFLTIEQDWNEILIVLTTSTSSSTSLSVQGSIEHIPRNGYQLSYNYKNKPDISESDLYSHEGSCKIMFTKDILSGSAEYYNNGKERPSYGKMKLRRSADDKKNI